MDSRPIEISEIDEFSGILQIPRAIISEPIVRNIRSLNEKEELEPLIRDIIHDYNKTPHGPTEIADIVTTNLHVQGKKKVTGFVLKGKSFKKVTSEDVDHQFSKMRTIPNIGLMIFCAVGDIQDDAQRDFFQCAKDGGSDYLIIDATDCARLLIAYGKVCHHDGLPFDADGRCRNSHEKPDELVLEVPTQEKPRYSVLKEEDISHGGAKRYSAVLLTNPHYSPDIIRRIIHEKTEDMKHREYYRSPRVEERWGEAQGSVVWLYIASSLEDVQNFNWRCISCWVDPDLPENLRPNSLNSQETLDGIDISWNKEHRSLDRYLSENQSVPKEVYLMETDSVCRAMITLGKSAIEKFQEYKSGSLAEADMIRYMGALSPQEAEASRQSRAIPRSPLECDAYDNACSNLFAAVDNMFLLYSPLGLKEWSQKKRDPLMQEAIKHFLENEVAVVFERKKICG
jgi:hypothetical protein